MTYKETPDIVTSSEQYAKRFSGRIGEWFLKVQSEAVLRMLSDYAGASVLDVGGGHGQLVEPLANNGYKVTILGSSEECKKRVQEFIDNNLCEFKVGDLLNIPFEDKSFDVVITFRQMAHVIDWKRFVRELTRAAGKAVIIDYPSLRSINYINHIFPSSFRVKKGVEADTRPFTLFRESEIIREFDENSFIFGKKYPQFFLPMFLHRKLRSPAISIPIEKMARLIGITGVLGSPVIMKLVRKDNA